MRSIFIAIVFISSLTATADAQVVQDFSLTNVINNQTVSLSTFPSCAGIAMIFTTNSCAFDEYYRGRISKLASQYHDKVPFILINSSPDPTETPDAMVKKAQQLNLNVPYLADKDQTLMTSLGANRSPQVYLLKNDGGKFVVVYKGAIDDNPQVETDVHKTYLKDAMDILLANQRIETAEIRPAGCTIRKK